MKRSKRILLLVLVGVSIIYLALVAQLQWVTAKSGPKEVKVEKAGSR